MKGDPGQPANWYQLARRDLDKAHRDLARQSGYRSSSAMTLLVWRLEQRAARERPLRKRMASLRAEVNREI